MRFFADLDDAHEPVLRNYYTKSNSTKSRSCPDDFSYIRWHLQSVKKEYRFMITEVRNKVKKFLKETIEADEVRIVRIDKTDGGWIAEADVAAKNQYLAAIKPEYRVFEKEHYVVRLNAELEVSSYKLVSDGSREVQEVLNYGF